MKIYFLPETGNAYKANLHTHSTVSDGRWTAEEIKERYMERGYSIVAYTDHQVFVTHNDLADENFLPLNGYEIDIPEDKPWDEHAKTCHFCLIALDKDRTVQNLYHDSIFIDKNSDKADVAKDRPPFVRVYDTEAISKIMNEARNDRFFVTYNHPVWSLESNDEYLRYHGMHAMEIVNYGSYVTGHEEHNGILYDNMLHNGEKIYCIAADDNHNVRDIAHPLSDSFGAFTVIIAEKLEYETVTQALLDGDFYASEGPEIYELYLDTDDNKIHVKTSEAVRVVMTTGERYNSIRSANVMGETITEAVFSFSKQEHDYIRFIVRDREGREACTNAYYVTDIMKKINKE